MIHILMGTKGQYIKMAPILREFENRGLNYNLIHTSQHFKITRKLAEIFQLKKPDIYITKKRDDLRNFPEMVIWFAKNIFYGIKLRKQIWRDQKGIVLLHGNTESSLLGLILAKISKIKIFHIESGLRSYDFLNPFPEELNTMLMIRFSDILFAPSLWAQENLRQEKKEKICTNGNTVFDALRYVVKCENYQNYQVPRYKYIVAAISRKETLYSKKRLKIVINAIELSASKEKVIFILHKHTTYALKKNNLFSKIEKNANIIAFYDYLPYSQFMKLISHSEFVITDGGGLQEETYFLNKPCLLLRKKTERMEGLNETACLSKFNFSIIEKFIQNYKRYQRKTELNSASPSKIIVDYLVKHYRNYF